MSEDTDFEFEDKKYNLDELCRLCGNYDSQLMPIFSGEGIEHNLHMKITKHLAAIKISPNDQIPSHICYQCVSTLITWDDLFEACLEVDKRLGKILKLMEERKSKKSASDTMYINSEGQNFCVDYNRDTDYVNVDVNSTSEIVNVIGKNAIDEQNNNKKIDVDDSVKKAAVDCMEKDETSLLFQCINDNDDITLLDESSLAFSNIDFTNPTIFNSDIESVNFGIYESSNDEEFQPNFEAILNEKNIKMEIVKPANRKQIRRPQVCHMCGKIFSSLRSHILTHSETRPHACPFCEATFKRKDHVATHVKSVHYGKKPSPRGYNPNTRVYTKQYTPKDVENLTCRYCSKILTTKQILHNHVITCHTKETPYKCEKCDVSFSSSSKLWYHITKQNHEKKQFLQYCEECGLEFENEAYFEKHKLKHINGYACYLCKMVFQDKNQLQEHEKNIHVSEKPFACNICHKRYQKKSCLQAHCTIHNQEKPYQCQFCNWRFNKKCHLTSHIRRHTGERPYICTICGKDFIQKGDMRKHKALHIQRQTNSR